MDALLSVCLGLGLSAACGFRIFVPLLVLSLGARTEFLELSGGFDWIGSLPALIAFAVATALEIGGYYVPWIDNLLDSVASPAAVVAGIVVSASVVTDMDPLFKWTLALIAGGSVAGLVQAVTTSTRLLSSVSTAGLGNPVISTVEAAGSVFLSVLAVVVPILAFSLVTAFAFWGIRRLKRRDALV